MSPMQTYEMACAECQELRWPYLAEKPESYVCYRCRSGVGVARREAGRRSRPKGSPAVGGKAKPE